MREGDGPWQECAASSTAAAALRERGRWKLGEPAPDFDAAAWSFRTVFDADADLLNGATLGLDGVATLWEAWLNGEQILQGDNMFVAQEREVATLLSTRSPGSLVATFFAQNRARRVMDVSRTLEMDLKLAAVMARRPDFAEGVRAVLVDKDQAPKWSPPSLEAFDVERDAGPILDALKLA